MGIFQFPTLRTNRPSYNRLDWSAEEMAQFYRALRLLNDQGIQIGLEQGLTDIGEPWLVFFDFSTQDVFLHIARIDGRCILICEHLSLSLGADNVQNLIEKLEEAVRTYMEVRARPSNVVVHPAARIITSLSAIYLFFKLDSDSASAKSAFERDSSGQAALGATRQGENAGLATQRSTLARIFEMTDTPLQAAMMAGIVASTILVATELNQDDPSKTLTQAADGAEAVDPAKKDDEGHVVAENDDRLERVAGETGVAHALASDGTGLIQIENATLATATDVAPNPEAKNALSDGDVETAQRVEMEAKAPASAPAENPASEEQQTAQNDADVAPRSAAEPAVATDESAAPVEQIEVEKKQDSTTKIVDFAALEKTISESLMSSILKLDVGDSAHEVTADETSRGTLETGHLAGNASFVTATAAAEKFNFSDVSLDNLDTAVENASTNFNTELQPTDIKEMFRVMLESFPDYELHVKDGDILIEQAGIDGAGADDIGIWTNVMNDGSQVSFVGFVDLVSQVETYVT